MRFPLFACAAWLGLVLASTPAYAIWPFDEGFSGEADPKPLEAQPVIPAAPLEAKPVVPPKTTSPVKPTPPKPVAPKPPAAPKAAKPKVTAPAPTPTTPASPPPGLPKVDLPTTTPPAAETKTIPMKTPPPAPVEAKKPAAPDPGLPKIEAPKAATPAPVKMEPPKPEPQKTNPPKVEAPQPMPPPIENTGPTKADPQAVPAIPIKSFVRGAPPAKEEAAKTGEKEDALPTVQIIHTKKPEGVAEDAKKKKEEGTIAGILQAKKEFTTLVDLLQSSGYLAMLKSPGNYTLFAPTDTAFRSLAHPTTADLKNPANIDLLKSLIGYHLLNGNFMLKNAAGKKASPNTLQGEVLEILDKKAGSAGISETIEMPNNGIIYVVDTVLAPPSLTKKP
jgi:uncharacterized surface protein with fasciclin (FAS1) repeats